MLGQAGADYVIFGERTRRETGIRSRRPRAGRMVRRKRYSRFLVFLMRAASARSASSRRPSSSRSAPSPGPSGAGPLRGRGGGGAPRRGRRSRERAAAMAARSWHAWRRSRQRSRATAGRCRSPPSAAAAKVRAAHRTQPLRSASKPTAVRPPANRGGGGAGAPARTGEPRARARSRLRRLSARLLSDRVPARPPARQRQRGSAGDDAAGRALCQRLRRPTTTSKAAEWYRLAADRGDREAMFALAMFVGGRGGPQDRGESARFLPPPPSSARRAAAYDLGLLYLEGRSFRRISSAPPSCFASAAQAGNPEAQYALATMYKDGSGVAKDVTRRHACWRSRQGGQSSTPRSNTRSRCSTAPASRRTRPRPPRCFARPRCKGSPIAQNRLARILAFGRGMPAADPVAGDQVAPHLQGRRRQRPRSWTNSCPEAVAGARAARRKGRQALDRRDQPHSA